MLGLKLSTRMAQSDDIVIEVLLYARLKLFNTSPTLRWAF